MSEETIEERVKRVVAKTIKVDLGSINLETKFEEGLDHLEIIIGLEEEFLITISDEEEEKIKTVQRAVDFIKPRLPVPSLS